MHSGVRRLGPLIVSFCLLITQNLAAAEGSIETHNFLKSKDSNTLFVAEAFACVALNQHRPISLSYNKFRQNLTTPSILRNTHHFFRNTEVKFKTLDLLNRIRKRAWLNFIRLFNVKVRLQIPIRIVKLTGPQGELFGKFPIFSNPLIVFSKSDNYRSGSVEDRKINLHKPHKATGLASVIVTGETMTDIAGQYHSRPLGIITAVPKKVPEKIVPLDGSTYRPQSSVIAQIKRISPTRDGLQAEYEVVQAPPIAGFISFWFVDMKLVATLTSIDPLVQWMAGKTVERLTEGFQASWWWREFWGDDRKDSAYARSEDGIKYFKEKRRLKVIRLFMDFVFQKMTFVEVIEYLQRRSLEPQWFAAAVRKLPAQLSSLDEESETLAKKLSASA